MPWYRIDIDARVSDEYVIQAKNPREAKRKAMKRFCKLSNFRFSYKKTKTRKEAQNLWL